MPRDWRNWLVIFRVRYIEVLRHSNFCNFGRAETEVLFVISRTSLCRGSLNRGSTVLITYHFLLNPLIPRSDYDLISPYNVILQSLIRSWESRKWSPTGESVWRVCILMLECIGLIHTSVEWTQYISLQYNNVCIHSESALLTLYTLTSGGDILNTCLYTFPRC